MKQLGKLAVDINALVVSYSATQLAHFSLLGNQLLRNAFKVPSNRLEAEKVKLVIALELGDLFALNLQLCKYILDFFDKLLLFVF